MGPHCSPVLSLGWHTFVCTVALSDARVTSPPSQKCPSSQSSLRPQSAHLGRCAASVAPTTTAACPAVATVATPIATHPSADTPPSVNPFSHFHSPIWPQSSPSFSLEWHLPPSQKQELVLSQSRPSRVLFLPSQCTFSLHSTQCASFSWPLLHFHQAVMPTCSPMSSLGLHVLPSQYSNGSQAGSQVKPSAEWAAL